MWAGCHWDTDAAPSSIDVNLPLCGSSLNEHLEVMRKCRKELNFLGAAACYNSMKSQGIAPTVEVFASLIHISSKTESCEVAEGWMQEMKTCNVVPDRITFNCLINAFARAKDGYGAEKWFKTMTENGIQGDKVTFKCLIRAFALQGCAAEMEIWFAESKKQFPRALDVDLYNVVMELYALKALPAKAKLCFDDLEKVGLLPNRRTYLAMISAYANAGDIEGAQEWCDKEQAAGFPLKVQEFTQLLKSCAPQSHRPANYLRGKDIFLQQLAKGIAPDHHNFEALNEALGKTDAWALCERNRVDIHAVSLSKFQN